jgi:hypothetical protein
MRVDLAEAEEILPIGKEQIGYARITRRHHDRKPTGKLVHAGGTAVSSVQASSPRGRRAG